MPLLVNLFLMAQIRRNGYGKLTVRVSFNILFPPFHGTLLLNS